jgi:hypothetical protein
MSSKPRSHLKPRQAAVFTVPALAIFCLLTAAAILPWRPARATYVWALQTLFPGARSEEVWEAMLRPLPIWLALNDTAPLAIDVFESHWRGRRCVAVVSAPAYAAPSAASLRASIPSFGLHDAAPTESRSREDFESAHVSLWCAAPTGAASSRPVCASGASRGEVFVVFHYHHENWTRAVAVDCAAASPAGTAAAPSGARPPQPPVMSAPAPAVPPVVALCTVFKPSAASGVAWVQSWLTHGVNHIYLFLNEGADGAPVPASLRLEDRARVAELVTAFPGRVTLALWPFRWYSGGSDASGTRRHLASVAAYTAAIYRWGHLYTHFGYFDFDVSVPCQGEGSSSRLNCSCCTRPCPAVPTCLLLPAGVSRRRPVTPVFERGALHPAASYPLDGLPL